MIEAAILCAVLGQYDPVPPGCVEVPLGCDTGCSQLGRRVVKIMDETQWCGYYFHVEVFTGWYNDVYACCDAEDVLFEVCINEGPWSDYDNWTWVEIGTAEYIVMDDPQYTHYDPQHLWAFDWYPRLSDVVYNDPEWGSTEPDPNARFVVGFRSGYGDGQYLTCPRQQSTYHITALAYYADQTPNSWDCPCDFNDNGRVGVNDFLHLQAHPEWFDVLDFLSLLAHWGACPHT